MTVRPRNVFIVQTAESHPNGRSKGNQISLINKQSALFKYRQHRKKRDKRTSSVLTRAPSPRAFDAQRTSWLLESRLPQCPHSPDGCVYTTSKDDGLLSIAPSKFQSFEKCYQCEIGDKTQLHDCYAGLRTDPFSCMPIRDSSVVLGVSDTYINMMIPHISQVAKVFNVHDVYLDIFWSMVFSEDTIDAVVAMAYCADASWRKTAGLVPKKDLFTHQARSLANLRRRLEDPFVMNTGVTICVLMYNCNIARSLGDMLAAKQHMSMIRHLLKTQLSIDALGYQGKLKPLLMQWEYFLTLTGDEERLIQRTERPKSVYPTLPLDDQLASLAETLPGGLKQLINSGRISCQVTQILGRAQEMMMAVAHGTTQAFLAIPNESPYPDFCAAIPCLDASEDGKESLERLLACVIFLLTSRLLSPTKWALWSLPATGGRTILTQQLFNCPVKSEVEKSCLIWMWLVTIDAWAIGCDEVPDKARKLMQRLKVRFPDTSDWSYLSNVVKDFFWTDDLEIACEKYWKACH